MLAQLGLGGGRERVRSDGGPWPGLFPWGPFFPEQTTGPRFRNVFGRPRPPQQQGLLRGKKREKGPEHGEETNSIMHQVVMLRIRLLRRTRQRLPFSLLRPSFPLNRSSESGSISQADVYTARSAPSGGKGVADIVCVRGNSGNRKKRHTVCRFFFAACTIWGGQRYYCSYVKGG